MTPRLTIVEDAAALIAAAADRITSILADTIATSGRAAVALTGGRTARVLYAALADPSRPWRTRIDWPALDIYWSDERHVPPSHADSNFGMARDALLALVPVREDAVHRIRGEAADPGEAAADYARGLERLDLSLLALGDDGHIASLFPHSDALLERQRSVVAVPATESRLGRTTLTPPALVKASATVLLASGESKAAAAAAALFEADDPGRWPVHVLRAAGDRLQWIIDRPAAARWPAAPIA